MILSMTGFGKARASADGLAVVAEVRSVNNRGREIRFRMPQELLAVEDALRQRVQESIARGRVDVTIGWDGAPPAAAGFAVNVAAADALVDAWRELALRYDLSDKPTVGGVLALPGVVVAVPREEVDGARLAQVARRALDDALAAHRAAREREGVELANDLRARSQRIETLVGEIRGLVEGSTARAAEELRARVQALLGELAADEQRLAQEIALLAQRADVTEELVRLAAHLERLAALFAPGAVEVGRTLEFLVQEIRREVNTLGAKVGGPAVDARTLEIKTELERLREQAANLE